MSIVVSDRLQLTIDLCGLELPARDFLLEHVLDLGSGPISGLGKSISFCPGLDQHLQRTAHLWEIEEEVGKEDDIEAQEKEPRLGAPSPDRDQLRPQQREAKGAYHPSALSIRGFNWFMMIPPAT